MSEPTPVADGVYVLECDVRTTALGPALRIQMERYDDQPMSWPELHAAFARRYPGRWAVQTFPPEHRLLNGAHKYHLFVLADEPAGLDLMGEDVPRVRP